MEPKMEYNLNRNFELRVVIFFLIAILFLLGSYTQKKFDENKSLKVTLKLLESSIEQELLINQQQMDSLQKVIQQQDKLHLKLKDSLVLLENERLHLKNTANENKAAIHRIRDVDSLRSAVAKHYN